MFIIYSLTYITRTSTDQPYYGIHCRIHADTSLKWNGLLPTIRSQMAVECRTVAFVDLNSPIKLYPLECRVGSSSG